MVAQMRAEVGDAALKPDIKDEGENLLLDRFYFVKCEGKKREVASTDVKVMAAEADVRCAKGAAAAASLLAD
eukprot:16083380-Heterocapsa_arctica.AAC.1